MEDLIKEVKELIKKYQKEDFEYGKPVDYLLFRTNTNKNDIEKEIINCKNLEFVEKQLRKNEIRYVLYFIYSRRKGRAYVLKFNSKIRIITIYPLGKKTLRKYRKKRFKK
ncbi:MAG: hypothetical protein NT076_05410 [Candidatus Pacearchaeota archaeon]|nr:hypothetical protein [Candidatus Pacearchaeota archaeon]